MSEVDQKFSQAISRFYMQDYKSCEFILSDVLKSNPNHVQACGLSGQLFQQLRNLEKAEAFYNKAISLQPLKTPYHYRLAILQQELGKLDEAELSFFKALYIDNDNEGLKLQLSMNYLYKREFHTAMAITSDILKRKPDYIDAERQKNYLEFLAKGQNEYLTMMEKSKMSFTITGKFFQQESPFMNNYLDDYYSLEIFKEYIDSNKVALDIGARSGYYSVLMAAWREAKTVYAFESDKNAMETLKQVSARNPDCDINTEYLGHAIGDGKARISEAALTDYKHEPVRTFNTGLKTTPLDELSISNIGFIKYNLPGFEQGFIKGAQETLSSQKPICFIRIKRGAIKQVAKSMEAFDYRMVRGNYTIDSSAIDCLFLAN